MTTVWGWGNTEYRFYWGRELAVFVNERLAREKVDRDLSKPFVEARLRMLLWRTCDAQARVADVAEEAAKLLSRGELVTSLYGVLDPFWRCAALESDKDYANQFLRGFQRDPLAMEHFRTMFRRTHSDAEVSRILDGAVLIGVAALMKAGELVVGERSPAPGSYQPGERVTDTPGDWTPVTSRSEASEEPDPSMNLPGSQAGVLTEAAKSGAPFCDI